MCLDVGVSHVRKPIPEMACFKILRYVGDGKWQTPYYDATIPLDTGWIMPLNPAKRKVREYRTYEEINGGYIHALTRIEVDLGFWNGVPKGAIGNKLPSRPKKGQCYRFHAVARDVVAEGRAFDADIVCKALYIPAFDVTGKHRNAILDI